MTDTSAIEASAALSLEEIAAIAGAALPEGAEVVTRLYPDATRPQSSFGESGVSAHALVHPTARLGEGIAIDPGAIVGPGAEIAAGSRIGAYSIVGPGV